MAASGLLWGELLGSITPSPSPWNRTSQTLSQHKAFLPETVFLRSFVTVTKNEHICTVFPLDCAVPIPRLTCSTSLATFVILWVYQFVCLLLLAFIMYPSSWKIKCTRCTAYTYGLIFTLKRKYWTEMAQWVKVFVATLDNLRSTPRTAPTGCLLTPTWMPCIHTCTYTHICKSPIRCCSWVEIEDTMLS